MVNARIIAKNTPQFLFKKIDRAKVTAKSKLEKITNCLRMTSNFKIKLLYKKNCPNICSI